MLASWELDRSRETGCECKVNWVRVALQFRFLLLRCLRSRSPSPVLSVVKRLSLYIVHDQVLILVLIDAHLDGLVLSSINLGMTLVTAAILPDGASGLQSPLPIRPSAMRALPRREDSSPPSVLPGIYHSARIHNLISQVNGRPRKNVSCMQRMPIYTVYNMKVQHH